MFKFDHADRIYVARWQINHWVQELTWQYSTTKHKSIFLYLHHPTVIVIVSYSALKCLKIRSHSFSFALCYRFHPWNFFLFLQTKSCSYRFISIHWNLIWCTFHKTSCPLGEALLLLLKKIRKTLAPCSPNWINSITPQPIRWLHLSFEAEPETLPVAVKWNRRSSRTESLRDWMPWFLRKY